MMSEKTLKLFVPSSHLIGENAVSSLAEKERAGEYGSEYLSFCDSSCASVLPALFDDFFLATDNLFSDSISFEQKLDVCSLLINAYRDAVNSQLPDGVELDIEYDDLERDETVSDFLFDRLVDDWLVGFGANNKTFTSDAVIEMLQRSPESYHSFYANADFDRIYQELHENLATVLDKEPAEYLHPEKER